MKTILAFCIAFSLTVLHVHVYAGSELESERHKQTHLQGAPMQAAPEIDEASIEAAMVQAESAAKPSVAKGKSKSIDANDTPVQAKNLKARPAGKAKRWIQRINKQQVGQGMAIAAFVLGLIMVVFGWALPILGSIMGLLAIIFGIIAVAQDSPGRGLAIAGIIMGAIGFVLSIIFLVAIFQDNSGGSDIDSGS